MKSTLKHGLALAALLLAAVAILLLMRDGREQRAEIAALQGELVGYQTGAAYGQYAIALQNAADFAESPHATGHMANTVEAMADFNESKPMTDAIDRAEAYLICTAPVPHNIPDYDCKAFDLSPTAMRPVVKQLQHGSFVLRQGTFSVKDMHGLPTAIGKEAEHNDAH